MMVGNRLGQVSTFDDQDRRLFETLANHASVAFENGRLVEQLRQEALDRRHEALHDALTGLPNRTFFIEQVEALTEGPGPRQLAVMLMDLDRFKEINDTLGHQNGDLVLREVAGRLGRVVRREDSVARLGGDEFAVVLADVGGVDEAEETAARIIASLTEPFVIEELSLDVGASVGIALSPRDGRDAALLLQRADVAMYEAKSSEKGISVYSLERDTYSPRRLALAGELRQAIEGNDVTVYYQPKARLSDGEVIGVEALVRWLHPLHGFLPPDDFVPVAEHSGIISSLTLYVLRTALSSCAAWRAGGRDIGVAVNLAMRSLLDPQLPEAVDALLGELALPPDRLTLELTESSIMADPARSITVLERLTAAGVRVSVDDFGTGYSSLAYLRRLPVHEVKIDKSFVFGMASDAGDAAIVHSIVELGHNLGLSVVAEGVEEHAVWRRLRAMACDIAQGYYLSRPLPADQLARWLDARPRLETGQDGTVGVSRASNARGRRRSRSPELPLRLLR
jgi:diguanylate cyclase (GGDEF)-like protein